MATIVFKTYEYPRSLMNLKQNKWREKSYQCLCWKTVIKRTFKAARERSHGAGRAQIRMISVFSSAKQQQQKVNQQTRKNNL